jgi:hypothetical protein
MEIYGDSGLVRASGSSMREVAPLGDIEWALIRHRGPVSMTVVRDRGWKDGLRDQGELCFAPLSLHRRGF